MKMGFQMMFSTLFEVFFQVVKKSDLRLTIMVLAFF